MEVRFFTNFGKRPNSTKIPIGYQYYPKDCTLKNETSIESPVLILRNELNMEPWTYQYCYIPKWGKYYYCSEPIWKIGTWEISCTCDILASYRGEIFNTNQYITRCSAEKNGYISDALYPATDETRLYSVYLDRLYYPTELGNYAGSYVVGLISGQSNSSVGSTTYWFMSPAQFRGLMTYLMADFITEVTGGSEQTPPSTDPVSVVTDISEDTMKAIFNPMQYIASVKWFPIDYSIINISSENITKFGWWQLSQQFLGKKIEPPQTGLRFGPGRVVLPQHPYAAERGAYMNHEPWTKYSLDIYPFERVMINPGLALATETETGALYSIEYYVQCDLITGEGVLVVREAGDTEQKQYEIYRGYAQIGVDIQIAQLTSNILQGVSSGVQAVGSGILGFLTGGIAGAITGAASGIADTIQSVAPVIQTAGSNGNMVCFQLFYPKLSAAFILPVDDNNITNGRPLCKNRLLGSYISGSDPDPVYVQCANVQFPSAIHKEDRDYIIAALENGVYLE